MGTCTKGDACSFAHIKAGTPSVEESLEQLKQKMAFEQELKYAFYLIQFNPIESIPMNE